MPERLDKKTLKAYRIDLEQFRTKIKTGSITDITAGTLEDFIASLHQEYKPKTVKRKIASVKALFHYLEYKDAITWNPFNKIHVKFRNPVILPKTIPLHTVEHFLSAIYTHRSEAKTDCQKKNSLRDIAVIELLFATGMRISELCSLKMNDVNLYNRSILIYGKGSKERKIQIENDAVIHALEEYKTAFLSEMRSCNHFLRTSPTDRFQTSLSSGWSINTLPSLP
ncbi:Tyrosine recombinase XerC [Eubacterium plexicaudatum ASF492]|nr:Tyrosine recombinase XerC [Eubacterium plexicaudatum ASF492]